MNFLKTHIEQISNPDIILCKPKIKAQEMPLLDLVILSAKFDENISSTLSVLEILGLAKPTFTQTHLGILHLNLRKGEVVGCKLCLRKKLKYAFIESLLIEISQNIRKKPKFQKNSIHFHLYDVLNIEDANNLLGYLDGVRGLDVLVHAKNTRCPHFFKSIGFNL
jgi:ribosomal protein L5